MDSGSQFALQDLPPLGCQRTTRDVRTNKQSISMWKQQLEKALDATNRELATRGSVDGNEELLTRDVASTSSGSKDAKGSKAGTATTPMTNSLLSNHSAGGSSTWMAGWPSAGSSSTSGSSASPGTEVHVNVGDLLQHLAPTYRDLAATLALSMPASSDADPRAVAAADTADSSGSSTTRGGTTFVIETLADLTLDQQLHACIKGYGYPASVNMLLGMGASACSRDPDNNGRTPLHVAAGLNGLTQLLDEELVMKALVGPTPMEVPVLEVLQLLVDKGADVNALDGLGCTPLATATLMGGTFTVGYLALRAKASLELPSCLQHVKPQSGELGITSLVQLSLLRLHWKAVPLLIQAGATWPDSFTPPCWDKAHGWEGLENRLVLWLQTGLLRWEAAQVGDRRRADAYTRLLELLRADLPGEGLMPGPPYPHAQAVAETRHRARVLNTTWAVLQDAVQVEKLVGLLALQQPSIFRAAGKGQRAAVLDPLLATIHLEFVTNTLVEPSHGRWSMHAAATAGAAVQLRVLQLLGADLDLQTMDYHQWTGVPYTPLMMACSCLSGQMSCRVVAVDVPAEQQQQQQQQDGPAGAGSSSAADVAPGVADPGGTGAGSDRLVGNAAAGIPSAQQWYQQQLLLTHNTLLQQQQQLEQQLEQQEGAAAGAGSSSTTDAAGSAKGGSSTYGDNTLNLSGNELKDPAAMSKVWQWYNRQLVLEAQQILQQSQQQQQPQAPPAPPRGKYEPFLLTASGKLKKVVLRRLEAVKVLVEAGVAVNHYSQTKAGPQVNALTLAADAGLYPIVEYLLPHCLAKAPDLSRMAADQQLLSGPLQRACLTGNARTLRLLVKAAGGPSSVEVVANLCLMAVALDLEAVKMMLGEGVPVNKRVDRGVAPLHAFVCTTTKASEEVERGIFDALMDAGADTELREDQGLTPVMLAVRKLSKHKAQWLIDVGADPTVTDFSGRSLMHHACLMGDFDWVQWALQAGCELSPKGVKDVVRLLQTTKLGLQPASYLENRVKLLMRTVHKQHKHLTAGSAAEPAGAGPALEAQASTSSSQQQLQPGSEAATVDPAAAEAAAAELLAAEEAAAAAAAAKAAKQAEKKRRQAEAKAAAAAEAAAAKAANEAKEAAAKAAAKEAAEKAAAEKAAAKAAAAAAQKAAEQAAAAAAAGGTTEELATSKPKPVSKKKKKAALQQQQQVSPAVPSSSACPAVDAAAEDAGMATPASEATGPVPAPPAAPAALVTQAPAIVVPQLISSSSAPAVVAAPPAPAPAAALPGVLGLLLKRDGSSGGPSGGPPPTSSSSAASPPVRLASASSAPTPQAAAAVASSLPPFLAAAALARPAAASPLGPPPAVAAAAAAPLSIEGVGMLPAASPIAPTAAAEVAAGAPTVAVPGTGTAPGLILPEAVLESAPCASSSSGSSSPQQQKGAAAKKAGAAAARKAQSGAGAKQPGVDREPGVCVVCMDARSCILMLPCRHLCCCGSCFEVLQARSPECPMCRCEVTQHLEVYI